MADLAALQKKRQELVKEIQRRGGKDKAPNFAKRLAALDSEIKQVKGGASDGTIGQNPPGSSTSEDTAVTQNNPFDSASGQTKKDLAIGLDVGRVNQAGSILGQNTNINGPLGNQKITIDPDTNQATVTQSLSPDQQSILDSGSKLTQMGQDLAKQQLSGYKPFQADTSAMNGGYKANTSGMTGYQADLSGMPDQYKADTSGMGNFNFQSDDAARQRIEDATFKRLARGMEQRQTADKENLAQSLYNRGIQFSSDPNSRYQQELKAMEQSQQEERQSYEQRAVELGGTEMSRNYDISSGTYNTNLTGNQARNSANLAENQQNMSQVESRNAMTLAARGQNLNENQALNSANLAEHQQAVAEQQAANSANLASHQQGMSDVSQLGQSTGTGLQLPNFPTYQGSNLDVTTGANVALQQQAQNTNDKQTNAAIEELKRRKSNSGTSSSSSDSAFVA